MYTENTNNGYYDSTNYYSNGNYQDNNNYYENNNYQDGNYEEGKNNYNYSSNDSDKKGIIIKICIIILCIAILIWLIIKLKNNNDKKTVYDPSIHADNVLKIRLASEKYFFIDDNMPKDHEEKVVSLNTLIGKNYVSEIVDGMNKVCSNTDTVSVLKDDGTVYILTIKLSCSTLEKEEVFYYNKSNYACQNCDGFTNMDGKNHVKKNSEDNTSDNQDNTSNQNNNQGSDANDNTNSNNQSDETEFTCDKWSEWSSKRIDNPNVKERTRTMVKGVKTITETSTYEYTSCGDYSKTKPTVKGNSYVETKTEKEGTWSSTKTSRTPIVTSETKKLIGTNVVSSKTTTSCPTGYIEIDNKCVSNQRLTGNLGYVDYNSGNYYIYNRPCDGLGVEKDANGRFTNVYKNCSYSRVTDMKTTVTPGYTEYKYQDLIETTVTYYRVCETKYGTRVNNSKKVYTDEYYEENNLPSGYEKLAGSEKIEYSYMYNMCEK